ncbi:NHL repeat-containing protein [Ralstonia wenshanensis]|uniref:NHL repeat-containing protein n=1 Tax=Ralstonia wenshanensis TaxID=2842456 RepID=UPI002AAD5510|nr:NHL repeat-containing protein [Ralstonia wenshanensis]MDY7510009.1 NHL repeat-containing protein [Ralstonia wenshanensis]
MPSACPPLLKAIPICLILAACGGGGDAATTPPPSATQPGAPIGAPVGPVAPTAPATYSIAGTVTGLLDYGSLTLLNNGADPIVQATDGGFSFSVSVAAGGAYAVSVNAEPLWQSCSVANGSGLANGNVNNVSVNCAVAQSMVSTIAGSTTAGYANGTGSAASFRQPSGVARDASGNLYVADYANHVIRKIAPGGVVTTLAGTGSPGHVDGMAGSAKFATPVGIAVAASGNIYVTEFYGNDIRMITPGGIVTTLAGSATAGSADGIGASASFNNPLGIAVDANENVYVADYSNNMIRKITPAGVVTTLAGTTTAGSNNGAAGLATFNGPSGIALSPSGTLYVAEWFNSDIRQISPAGVVSTLAGSGATGSDDGVGTAATFSLPVGLAIGTNGVLYVADDGNNLIRMVTPAGVVATLAGSINAGSADGPGSTAMFNQPSGIAVDTNGNLYVADLANNMIRYVAPTP